MNPALDHDVGMSKDPDGALVRRFPVTDLTTAAPATRTGSGGFNGHSRRSAARRAFILLLALLLALPTLLLSPTARAHDSFDGELHITYMNTDGWTDLHHAAYDGYRDAAEELISAGADLNVRNDLGGTPLHAAARGNEPGVGRAAVDRRRRRRSQGRLRADAAARCGR